LVSFLREEKTVKREYRHYEKRIDVVALCSVSGELCAIEAKREDWKRALRQAVVNLAAAEKSYIAIHSDFVHRVQIADLDNYGIGLFSVGSKWGDVEIVKEANSSQFVNLLMNRRIKNNLLQRGIK